MSTFVLCRRWSACVLMMALFLPLSWSGHALAADGTPAASPAADEAAPDCIAAYAAQGIGTAGDACLIFVHAAAETPTIDIYVDDVKSVEGKPLSSTATIEQDVVAFAAGKHRFQVTAAGDSLKDYIVKSNIELAAGQAYDVVVFGTLAETRIKAYPADLSPLAIGAARVRYINASPASGTVDVRIVPAGETTQEPTTLSNVKYGRASKFVELPDQAQTSAVFLETVPTVTAFDDAVGSQIGAFPNTVYSYILVSEDVGNNSIYHYAFTRFIPAASS